MTITPEQVKHCMCGCMYVEEEECPHCNKVTEAETIAQQAADIERLREALKAVRYRMDMLGGFDNRFTLRKLVNAALNGGGE